MAGKEKFLSKRILATLLAGAVLGVCNLMPVYAANSGGTWSGESWTKDDEYIGDKSPTGSTVVIAEDNSGKRVYGGKDNRAAVANNTVTITGTIGNAYGGAGSDYDVSSNHVIVDGGTVTNTLQGGSPITGSYISVVITHYSSIVRLFQCAVEPASDDIAII